MGRHRAYDRWQERYETIINEGQKAKKHLKIAKQCGFNTKDKVIYNGEKGYISEVYIFNNNVLHISITAPRKSDNEFPLSCIYFDDTKKNPQTISCKIDWENIKLDKSEIKRLGLNKKKWI